MKNHKASGEDNISVELIKYGRNTAIDIIYELIKKKFGQQRSCQTNGI